MSQVAKEVAEQEFDRFCEAMDLDVDTERMDSEDRKSLDEARHIVVRAIERGQLIIDDKGQPQLIPSSGGDAKPIVFYEPTGATYMSTDQHKKTHEVAKLCAVLGDMTRTNAKLFSNMPARDFKVCKTLVTLFLG